MLLHDPLGNGEANANFSDGLLCESNSIRFDRQLQATFHHFNRNASCRDKVKSVSLNHRFIIAWHSPEWSSSNRTAFVRLGEKGHKPEIRIEQVTFSGPA
jgi:hypothetical protein